MGYLCGDQCWVTARSGLLCSKTLNAYLYGRQRWVTVRGGSLVGTYGVFVVRSQHVVACFARRHLTRICTAVSVGPQYVVARFARRHLQGYLCGDQCWGHSAWWLGCFGVNIIGLRPSLQSGKMT